MSAAHPPTVPTCATCSSAPWAARKRCPNAPWASWRTVARLDIDQVTREHLVTALGRVIAGRGIDIAHRLWWRAANPLCACAGTRDGPGPESREIRILMYDGDGPDRRCEQWARRTPVVWCACCARQAPAGPVGVQAERPTERDLIITIATLDWLLMLVGEHDRGDLAAPLRFARAFTESVRQHGGDTPPRAQRGDPPPDDAV